MRFQWISLRVLIIWHGMRFQRVERPQSGSIGPFHVLERLPSAALRRNGTYITGNFAVPRPNRLSEDRSLAIEVGLPAVTTAFIMCRARGCTPLHYVLPRVCCTTHSNALSDAKFGSLTHHSEQFRLPKGTLDAAQGGVAPSPWFL